MTSVLYQWGIIYDPEQKKRIKCNLPLKASMKSSLTGDFEQVACGTNFTIVLHSSGRVLVIGDEARYGRLGLGNENTIAEQLTPISGNYPPIGSIRCGSSTSLLLSKDQRELWGFGKGIGATPKQIYQTDQRITHCACNENSIVIVINGNRLEERHFNRDGFTDDDWTGIYQLNENEGSISHLDLGSSFNGFVTEQGNVYLWGSNVPIDREVNDETFIDISIKNIRRRNLPDHINERPIAISCSRGQFHGHALLLTSNGKMYALGSNYKGKLGIGENQSFTHQWSPVEMKLLSSPLQFSMIAAGGIHSSALSTDGKIVTWGCGSDGRLGHAEAQGHRYLYKETEPKPIETLLPFRTLHIATSYYHMAAIVRQSRS